MQDIKSAYHFEVHTADDICYVFATVMSRTDSNIIIDLWCPEYPLFSTRFTAPLINNLADYLHNYINTMLLQNNMTAVIKQMK